MNHQMISVHADARIGKNVTISSFSTIHGNVVIGDNTWIGPNVVIMDGARIGNNCRIFPGAVIAGDPQDLKYKGEDTLLEVGDNTIIREYVTLNRGTASTGKTVIGSDCLIMAYVHIAHDCYIGNHCIIGAYSALAGEIHVDDWAIVSGATLVHQFVSIGSHVFIGAAGKVRMDVPPFIKADREPLSYMGVNAVGLQRRNFSSEKIAEIHEIYRILYLKGLNNTQAIQLIEKDFVPSAERDAILSFVKNSKRGVIRGYHQE